MKLFVFGDGFDFKKDGKTHSSVKELWEHSERQRRRLSRAPLASRTARKGGALAEQRAGRADPGAAWRGAENQISAGISV